MIHLIHKWLWGLLVVIAVYLLIRSILDENILLGILALVLAYTLKKQVHKI
ncbi:hypothetical protein [Gracilibacillus sp. YIM 98692]|uniref:hypothetical protein n=1 Tax=Gracilibacillus sp. YIM 98692 TaxID=2663532 RepID=UPI0013D1A796|nr:hypothetical protein [Gracilibacillus sp. YIM 98692]